MTEKISYEMIRFNEAIDEALAESIASYSAETARTRDTFLAVLGHDLRSSLHVMAMAGHFKKKRTLHLTQSMRLGRELLPARPA